LTERPLGITGRLESISKDGNLAVLVDHHVIVALMEAGTLATAPLSGGAPRQLLQDVTGADWSPDGRELAVTHFDPARRRWSLEYPIGTTLYDTSNWLERPRVSRDGTRIVVLEHERPGDNRGFAAIVTVSGDHRVVTPEYTEIVRCAWSPAGDEVWFSADSTGSRPEMLAVNESGAIRHVLNIPGAVVLEDVKEDGRLLLQTQSLKGRMLARKAGEASDVELTWMDDQYLGDITQDGNTVLFTEQGQGGGPSYSTFIRSTDGAHPALRVGEGNGIRISPDRKYVLIVPAIPRKTLSIAPLGAGATTEITFDLETAQVAGARWFSDGNRLILTGNEAGRPRRAFEYTILSKTLRPITPEGLAGSLMSPDERLLIVNDLENRRFLWRTDGTVSPLTPAIGAADFVLGWATDNRSVFIVGPDTGARRREIFRVDTVSGRKVSIAVYGPLDVVGVGSLFPPVISADGRTYVYRYFQTFSDLFVSEVRR